MTTTIKTTIKDKDWYDEDNEDKMIMVIMMMNIMTNWQPAVNKDNDGYDDHDDNKDNPAPALDFATMIMTTKNGAILQYIATK